MLASPRLAAALALLWAGPCFQLRISSDVEVHSDGASRRTTVVERTDADKIAFDTGSDARDGKPPALRVVLDDAFRAERSAEPGVMRVARTRTVEPLQRARDVALRRDERGPAAANDALVRADDFVLFRRIRYHETIRDAADRDTSSAAGRKLGDLVAAATSRAAADLLGSTYDLGPLNRWLLGAGKQAFGDLLVASLETGLDPAGGADAMLAVFEREAIAVDAERLRRLVAGEPGGEADLEAFAESLARGAIAKTASLLRRRGATDASPGEPIAPEELAFLRREDAVSDAFARAFEAVAGDRSAFQAAAEKAGPELFGCFGGALFDPSLGGETVRWRTQLRMPGRLVRTNGAPLSDGSILWLKLSNDLAMRATTLEAESVVLDDRAVAALGGDVSGFSTDDALEALADLGLGRERAPNRERVGLLAKAVAGEAAARAEVAGGDAYETVRRLFRIPKRKP